MPAQIGDIWYHKPNKCHILVVDYDEDECEWVAYSFEYDKYGRWSMEVDEFPDHWEYKG